MRGASPTCRPASRAPLPRLLTGVDDKEFDDERAEEGDDRELRDGGEPPRGVENGIPQSHDAHRLLEAELLLHHDGLGEQRDWEELRGWGGGRAEGGWDGRWMR